MKLVNPLPPPNRHRERQTGRQRETDRQTDREREREREDITTNRIMFSFQNTYVYYMSISCYVDITFDLKTRAQLFKVNDVVS